jgi:hypothetical protein
VLGTRLCVCTHSVPPSVTLVNEGDSKTLFFALGWAKAAGQCEWRIVVTRECQRARHRRAYVPSLYGGGAQLRPCACEWCVLV